MKSVLERLAIPSFSENAIKEINYAKLIYSKDDTNLDLNAIKKRKKILFDLLEVFIGTFDLDYNLKIMFNDNYDSEEYIYLDDAYIMNFDCAFYRLYQECFLKYIDKIYLLNDNRIDNDDFRAMRLAYLNKNRDVLEYYIISSYNELISKLNNVKEALLDGNIDDKDIDYLVVENNLRNSKLKTEVMNYPRDGSLSFNQVRNVYNCFSSDIFSSLNKKEKIHLVSLLNNYFSYSEETNLKLYKKSIDDQTTSKEALAILIKCLLERGTNLIIKKNNEIMIENVLSGIRYIYENETDKKNLKLMDDVLTLVNSINR